MDRNREKDNMKTMIWNGQKIMGFNTGRQYSPKGQRIIAVQMETVSEDIFEREYADIRFEDIDRNIGGTISCCLFTQEDIMRAYDQGNYVCASMPTGFDLKAVTKSFFTD